MDIQNTQPKYHWLRLTLLSLLSLFLIAIVTFTLWAYSGGRPTSEALAALESNNQITVIHDDLITFTPTGKTTTSGLIFYPGGRVDARAYAPAAQTIAQAGHTVVIVPVPLRLAFFRIGGGDAVRERFPEIDQWAVAGHSLGGVAASLYVQRTPEINRLVLWASYPSSSLSDRPELQAISIYGTNDGLLLPEEVEASRALLPERTRFVEIQGGNHAQFGWYGPQGGDQVATISHADQAAQVVSATLAIFQ